MRSYTAFLALLVTFSPFVAQAAAYPHIPEPMVFDMVRPLGAARGELEINTLAQKDLSGRHDAVEWAPEIEIAFAQGMAIEFELPIENRTITDYKMGLQGTFGTFNNGRGVHGVQYLGLYNRQSGRWENTALYLIGHRFGERFSTMSMAGVGDVTIDGDEGSNFIFNHTTFYDTSDATTLGLEFNLRTGAGRYALLMPQVHQKLAPGLNVQAGVGAVKADGEVWRPRAGLRLIKEF
ncbi:MAG: hypothetical protein ABW063_02395 [Caulobacter sp.]